MPPEPLCSSYSHHCIPLVRIYCLLFSDSQSFAKGQLLTAYWLSPLRQSPV